MVLHNPNNWHWVSKDVTPWAKDYLTKELVGIKAESEAASVEVSKILSMDGDVEVSQRKGKVITIYDVRLQLEYTGKVPRKSEVEGEENDTQEISGTITIPEVAHDTEEDEFVFEVELYGDDATKQPAKELVRSKVVPQLRKKLPSLGPALMAEHGKDIQHAPGTNPSAGFAAPRTLQSSSINKSSGSSSTTTTTHAAANGATVNTTSVTDQQEFRTTAEQLYETFTDPQRIAAFTRASPRLWEGAQEGARYEIFGGNVSGSFVKLDKPSSIEQKWRLAQWPAGHYSTMNIKFEQNDVDAVTIMRVDWNGVPIGQEEPTKRNWSEYYVRSIKTTFGFGTVL
ncbi:hypothetical protein AMS68_004981 [Peltaster fructicola]|uniref:Activator of Hsp90 ATPase AHSA1-like N-terminal domain-containing protein n=1 Tax=Peltaster fructicola TaxID=286661 RepID=A0A6H0XXK8_9PEZI|nr:hypothetical protein AMS68_004981 [Peltaster fructicola]